MKFNILLHPQGELISDSIRQNKCWEGITTEILIELINDLRNDTSALDGPSDGNDDVIVYDIGANIGWFSLVSASNNVKCVAFEPVSANFKLLKNAIAINKYEHLIEPHQIALGNRNGVVNINICARNMGFCSERKLPITDLTGVESCAMQTFDSFIDNRKFKRRSAIVKIDVEESELDVLEGMIQFLRSGVVGYIIIEIDVNKQRIFDILKETGYVYAINIGYDKENHTIDYNSKYIKTKRLFYDINTIQNISREMQSNANPQMNVLFSNAPFSEG